MKEKYFKIVFIIFIILLTIIAIYICVFKNNKKTLISSKTKNNIEKYTLISNKINIGIIQLDILNPILSNNKHVQEISRLIFDPLFTITEDYKIKGILAKECSMISEKTYIIKLNENIIWHDGNKFDSSDVIFTINMLKKLKEGSIYYHNIKNIKLLQEIDEYTIKIVIDKDEPYFEYNLIFPILSSKYFDEENFKLQSKNTKIVGTGPFFISDVNNDRILLKRNLNLKDIKIDTITINLYDSLAEIIEAFKSSEIDIFTSSNKNIREYIKNTEHNIVEYINRKYSYLALNCQSKRLSNIEIRQAISYSINKQEIIKNVYNGYSRISNFPLDFGSYAYDISNDIIIYDTNKAKNILVDNGWQYSINGWNKTVNNSNLKIELEFVVNTNNIDNIKVANNIKEQLGKVGILVNIKEVNEKEYNKYLKNKNYDLIMINSTYSYSPSLEKFLGEGNLSNYTNKEIAGLLKEVELLTIENEIKEKYTRINDIYNEEVPYISLYYDISSIIYSPNLKGTIMPNSYNLFFGIEDWYREYEK